MNDRFYKRAYVTDTPFVTFGEVDTEHIVYKKNSATLLSRAVLYYDYIYSLNSALRVRLSAAHRRIVVRSAEGRARRGSVLGTTGDG